MVLFIFHVGVFSLMFLVERSKEAFGETSDKGQKKKLGKKLQNWQFIYLMCTQ